MTNTTPNTEDALALVQKLHASPRMGVFAVAGAGTQAISWLLGVAGASRTVLELTVPYSPNALAEFVGYEPEQAVSPETALDMAQAAYRRALRLREGGEPVAGVACTATIATDRPKRGEHRCHVAYWTGTEWGVSNVRFLKGLRDRAGEDAIASMMVLNAFAAAAGVDGELRFELDYEEVMRAEKHRIGDALRALAQDYVDLALLEDGGSTADAHVSGGVLPGSFNPLHDGHKRLAAVASRILHAPVTYELSMTNVDKPPLDESEIRRRAAQFQGVGPLAVTKAHVFYEKALLFPGCVFVIGHDTAARLVDARYYDGDDTKLAAAMELIRQQGCQFLVGGRVDDSGEFRTLSDITLPSGFEDLFRRIPPLFFREDVSSTELRGAADLDG